MNRESPWKSSSFLSSGCHPNDEGVTLKRIEYNAREDPSNYVVQCPHVRFVEFPYLVAHMVRKLVRPRNEEEKPVFEMSM